MNSMKIAALVALWAGWAFAIPILVFAPQTYAQAVGLTSSELHPAPVVLVVTGYLGILTVGIFRNWRWAFWLTLIAFIAGALRVFTLAQELTGRLPYAGPGWFAATELALFLVGIGVGVAMYFGYRKAGIWGNP